MSSKEKDFLDANIALEKAEKKRNEAKEKVDEEKRKADEERRQAFLKTCDNPYFQALARKAAKLLDELHDAEVRIVDWSRHGSQMEVELEDSMGWEKKWI